MTELGCDSTEKLRALLPRLEQELKDTVKFKDFYQFTFTFAKNPGQKGLGERKIHIRRKPHLHEPDSGYNQPGDGPATALPPERSFLRGLHRAARGRATLYHQHLVVTLQLWV